MNSDKIFTKRYFMFDLARQRSFVRGEFILWLDALSRLGYNGVGLYLEAAFEFDSIPGVIRKGVMTVADAAWAVEEGKKRGILIFPMTNVVGHMEHFFRQERYRDLLTENTGYRQMNFFDPRAEELAMRIVHEYSAAFGTGIVHIGGDETILKPEERLPYAKFLARICDNLLSEGITPAIWDDMIWTDPELCECFDRRTAIFDWCYYGHRPESPKRLRELGFNDVIVCPSDNGWECFICHQHTTGWLHSRKDIPVKPDEVEALLEDARDAGVYAGMITNWENCTGRNIWGQWTAFARGGLYMNSRIAAREENDDLIEAMLFGHKTPYSAVTHLLQDKIPYEEDADYRESYFIMRKALFYPDAIIALYEYLAKRKTTTVDLTAVASEAEQMLDTWQPQGEFEELCANAMYAICGMIKAADAVARAVDGQREYYRAALIQFEAPSEAKELLLGIAASFRLAKTSVKDYSVLLERAIANTGHTKNDLVILGETCEKLAAIADVIEDSTKTIDIIPITRFERVLDRAIKGEFIVT